MKFELRKASEDRAHALDFLRQKINQLYELSKEESTVLKAKIEVLEKILEGTQGRFDQLAKCYKATHEDAETYRNQIYQAKDDLQRVKYQIKKLKEELRRVNARLHQVSKENSARILQDKHNYELFTESKKEVGRLDTLLRYKEGEVMSLARRLSDAQFEASQWKHSTDRLSNQLDEEKAESSWLKRFIENLKRHR